MREAKAKDRVVAKKAAGGDQNNVSDLESQYEDEFDSYLERLDVPGRRDDNADDFDYEVNFMNEFEQELAKKREKKKERATNVISGGRRGWSRRTISACWRTTTYRRRSRSTQFRSS
ncbi:uncharacterized protein LOC128092961 [Culex pipiens pallens]|uniref:uncharacterized protein LOC128092961 n=1 Tax=Culex pipiens pallens TaxID=42434 RepID=UPI0022AB0153|nr:uncharacterized protein LOC128092961 [Culex pipiens pallens]XP_052564177.1 uncharacterized protein LOC128092961 [Culex pipiens pallens]